MSFQQLDPAIPVTVIGRGDGYAFGVIDYGQEHNLIWVTAIDATGEIWCAPNPMVRMQPNWTMGRERPRVPGLPTSTVTPVPGPAPTTHHNANGNTAKTGT